MVTVSLPLKECFQGDSLKNITTLLQCFIMPFMTFNNLHILLDLKHPVNTHFLSALGGCKNAMTADVSQMPWYSEGFGRHSHPAGHSARLPSLNFCKWNAVVLFCFVMFFFWVFFHGDLGEKLWSKCQKCLCVVPDIPSLDTSCIEKSLNWLAHEFGASILVPAPAPRNPSTGFVCCQSGLCQKNYWKYTLLKIRRKKTC